MLKIYEENQQEAKPDTYLRLITIDYDIMLVGCNKDGSDIAGGSIILSIHQNGTMSRHCCCGVPGIQTDTDERIMQDN